jgi:hypothetical protein
MMAKIRIISGDESYPKVVAFVCPGCNEEHKVMVRQPNVPRPSWEFNGDYTSPTLKPSIDIKYTKYENGFQNWQPGDKAEQVRCHSIITDGQIEFCSDSTHHLAGQKLALPDID